MPTYFDITASNTPQSSFDYSFDDARQDQELLSAVKRYAAKTENKVFKDDDEAFDWFVSDRRWKDSNTASMLIELNRVKGGVGTRNINEDDLADLSVIRERWDRMPGAFERIAQGEVAGGFGAIAENVGKAILDPSMLVGGLAGRFGGYVTKKIAAGTVSKGFERGVRIGSAVTTEAALSGGFEAGIQEVEMDLGLRQEKSTGQIALAAGLGGLLSAPGYLGVQFGNVSRDSTDVKQIQDALAETKKLLEDPDSVKQLRAALADSEEFSGKLELPGGEKVRIQNLKQVHMPKIKQGSGVFKEFAGFEPQSIKYTADELIRTDWPETRLFDVDWEDFFHNYNKRMAAAMEELPEGQTFNPDDFEEVIVNMDIDDFLKLSNDIDFDSPESRQNIEEIKELIRSEVKLRDLPELSIQNVEGVDRVMSVYHHDGRHRAQAMKELGMDRMPVRIRGTKFDAENSPITLLPQTKVSDPLFRVNFEKYADDVNMFNMHKEGLPLTRNPLYDDATDVVPIEKMANSLEKVIEDRFKKVLPEGDTRKDFLERFERLIKTKLPGVTDTETLQDMVDDIIGEFGDDIIKKGRGVETAAARQGAARKATAGFTEEEVLGSLQNNVILDSVQQEALRLLRGSVFNKMMEARKAAKSASSAAIKASANKEFMRYMDIFKEATILDSIVGTEAARSLASRRFNPGTPEGAFAKITQQIGKTTNKALGGESAFDVDDEVAEAIMDAIGQLDLKNPMELEVFSMNLAEKGSTTVEKVREAWYNGVLSGLDTALINASGSIMTMAANILETQMANVTSGRAFNFSLLKGYLASVPQAWQIAKRTFMTELPTDPLTRMETTRGRAIPSYIWDWDENKIRQAGIGEGGFLGRQIRYPGRFLMAFDDAMKHMNKQAILTDHFEREARQKMAEEGKDWSSDKINAYIQTNLLNPSKEASDFATERARVLTFTNRPGKVAEGIKGLAEDIPMGWLFVPFVRTPANIISYALEPVASGAGKMFGFGPFGRTKEDLLAGGFRAQQANARMLMSWGIIGAGVVGAATGVINGSGPRERGERNVWQSENIPWSLKVGNTQYQWNRADPVAIPLALGAAINETFASINDEQRQNATYVTFMSLMSEALLDKTWFQGVENVVNMLTQPDRYADTVTAGLVRSTVPAIVGDLSRAMDPRTTAPMTYMEVLQDRIGFDGREQVPSRMDVFGREIPIEFAGGTGEGVGAFIGRMVSPFKAKTMSNDPIAKELIDLRVSIAPPSKTWKGIELNSEQYYIYSKAKGRYLHDSLKYYIGSNYWAKSSDEWKREKVDEIKRKASEVADVMLLGVYPDLEQLRRRKDVNPTTRRRTKQRESEVRAKRIFDFDR